MFKAHLRPDGSTEDRVTHWTIVILRKGLEEINNPSDGQLANGPQLRNVSAVNLQR